MTKADAHQFALDMPVSSLALAGPGLGSLIQQCAAVMVFALMVRLAMALSWDQ
jgi:hypothetical protein